MKAKLFTLLAALMCMNLFAEEATVVFEANGHTKKVTVDLPHEFRCDYDHKNGELDRIIQEFYELPIGGRCVCEAPVVSGGNGTVEAGLTSDDQYIDISEAFEGTVTVKGKYDKYTGSELVEYVGFDYSLTISISFWDVEAGAFEVPDSWAADATTVTAADFPNFMEISAVQAQSLTVPASGTIYVIHDITASGDVKYAVYQNGAYNTQLTLTNDDENNNRATISLLTALGAVYYTVLSEPATLVISGDKYFAGATTVAISCTTQRAEIYYTLDGTSPVTNPSRIVYEDPFEITEETTVKAASCNGGLWSAVVEMEFEKGEIVVFAANNNTKEVVAPLPHTFWCNNSSPYEELDGIIQELYAIPIGNYCKEDNTPTASGNAAVTAGKDGRNHYITVSEVFDGTATVSGVYYNITDELHSETIDYSITISIRTLVTATPTIFGTPEFTTSRNVNFSCATAGATIYYTLDGSDPITSPSRMTYAGSFEVTATTTVKAAAYKQGVWSEVAEKTFTKLETPVISGDRYFTKSTSVAITCATAGATIYYTLDGELPQYKPSSRIAYDGPFMLTESTTVRAAAYLNNLWSGSVDMTFEKGVTVVFEANSNRKEMIAPLPHTFACQYSSEDGELDEVIQALYPLHYGGFCEGDAPTASGNAAVSAGKNSNDQFIYISRTFEGKATVSGIYREWDSDKIWSTKFNYSLTIYMKDDITLTDNADNSSIIDSHDDMTVNSVTLSGRKLWKDGKWNTLCLPFDVSTTSGPLSSDNVQAMVLRASDSRLEGTTLTLNFDNAPATILAGTPFIVKWQKPASYVAYNPAAPEAECSDIVSPVFEGVTMSNANRDVTSSDGTVRFKGTYQSTTFKNADQSILFLGAENTLYYPQQGATIGAQRAYFDLGTAQARQFVLNFGEDNATGIISTTNFTNYTNSADVWYTIDGVRLDAQPTRKGLYIHRGRKVVVK